MNRSRINLVAHELVGLPVLVLASRDPRLAVTTGVVVDETRNTLRVQDGQRIRQVVKSQALFEFVLSAGERVRLDGRELVGRPEDRVKRLR